MPVNVCSQQATETLPPAEHASYRQRRAEHWTRALRDYRTARPKRATCELAITAVAFGLSWTLLLLAIETGRIWLYLLALLPGAGFLMRLFMIQHDCGHGSFFPSRRANDWVGRILGVVTLTPYDHWRRSHAFHHANAGNLDRRGIGDVLTMTVSEYRSSPWWRRLCYWVYRQPLLMFGLGPLYFFVLQHRIPFGFMRKGWRPWFSTMGTNVVTLAVIAVMISAVGTAPFFLIHTPLVLLAGGAGIWLFYVQHQFEQTHWARGENWSAREAALYGSSHYDLPAILRWMTANIGIHHVHHLSSRIPFYRLSEVLEQHAELRDLNRVTFRESIRGLRHVLWDAKRQRLISFATLRACDEADSTDSHNVAEGSPALSD